MPVVAIIGGSGLTRLEGLEISQRELVETPYGDPSGPLTHGSFSGEQVILSLIHI